MIWIENNLEVTFFTSSRKKSETDHSIAFDLTEDFGNYGDIDIVIFRRDADLVFKASCFADPTEDFKLRVFPNEDEHILIFENDLHRIYCHLS